MKCQVRVVLAEGRGPVHHGPLPSSLSPEAVDGGLGREGGREQDGEGLGQEVKVGTKLAL